MDSERIEELLARYWQCETSLEEEAELRACFNGGSVPPHLLRYQGLFVYQQLQQEEGLGKDFDARILARIGLPEKELRTEKVWMEKERTEKERTEESAATPVVVKARRLSLTARFMPLFKAAAAVAVLLGLGNVMQHSVFADTCEVAAADTVSQQVSTPSVALSDETLLHDNLRDSLSRVKELEESAKELEESLEILRGRQTGTEQENNE